MQILSHLIHNLVFRLVQMQISNREMLYFMTTVIEQEKYINFLRLEWSSSLYDNISNDSLQEQAK